MAARPPTQTPRERCGKDGRPSLWRAPSLPPMVSGISTHWTELVRETLNKSGIPESSESVHPDRSFEGDGADRCGR